MNRTSLPRRVAGLLLLVAAAAVALRNDRDAAAVYAPSWAETIFYRYPPAVRTPIAAALRASSDVMAALVVATLGLGLAALRHRPFVPPGRRWPGRGMAAIAVAGLAIVFELTSVLIDALADPSSPYSGLANPRFLFTSLQRCQGASRDAILGAWVVLALAGRWRSAEVGLGRLGRAIGWCWLGSIAFELFRAIVL